MSELYAVLTELVITESKRRPSLFSVFSLWLQFLPIPRLRETARNCLAGEIFRSRTM